MNKILNSCVHNCRDCLPCEKGLVGSQNDTITAQKHDKVFVLYSLSRPVLEEIGVLVVARANWVGGWKLLVQTKEA
jgi:hypothetical protein